MSRFARYSSDSEVPAMGGDAALIGVWDQGAPDAVPEGFVSSATNATFRNRRARTRLGSVLPTSFLHADLDAPFYGSGLFSDPQEREWMLLVTEDEVWQVRDGHTPRRIALPEPVTGRCAIVQGFDEVLMFRGADLTPLRWNGQHGIPFVAIDQSSGGGTRPIPNGPDFSTRPGLVPRVVNSRVIVPHGRNRVSFSDIEDYERYDAAFADFNLSAANDDTLTGLLPMGQTGLLVGKDQSLAILSGIDATLAVALKPVTDALGVMAGGTMAKLGADAVFLSSNGVFSVGAVFEDRLEAAAVALSRPVEKLFERVNWSQAAGAVATVWNEYYFLAVPIDGAERNTVVLPYNTQSKAWEGVHVFPEGWAFDALHVTDFRGRKRLMAVDYESGRVHLLYEGRHDRLAGSSSSEIGLNVRSRGYALGSVERKTIYRGKVQLTGWNPQVTLSVHVDGVNTEREALVWEPVRERYKTFGLADYDPNNVNDDHAVAGREDYSVDPDTAFDPDDAGVDFDLEQTHQLPIALRARGRFTQVEIDCTRGTLEVASVEIEGVLAERKDTKA